MFYAWRAFEDRGALPRAGGWLDQPLAFLVLFNALTMVAAVARFAANPKADWNKLGRLHRDVMTWLEIEPAESEEPQDG